MPSNCSTTINSLIQLHTYSSAGHVARGGGRAHASRRSWPRRRCANCTQNCTSLNSEQWKVQSGAEHVPNVFACETERRIYLLVHCIMLTKGVQQNRRRTISPLSRGNYFESISFEANEQFAVKKRVNKVNSSAHRIHIKNGVKELAAGCGCNPRAHTRLELS